MATSDAPVSIGSISLIVNSLDKVAEFYRDIVGLNEISRDGESCVIGQGNNQLLTLLQDRSARRYPGEAGLYHTAFLLPERADLGSWLCFAHAKTVKLDGAADHLVSEAVYLTDPEGNGVEIYADRDRSHWTVNNGLIELASERLDFAGLKSASTESWDALPDGSVIGHVHLQVGDVATADEFYRDKLGLARTAGFEQASFYGTGGYHHHLAGNIWHSAGSGIRPDNATGFHEVELSVMNGDVANEFDFGEVQDPWGMKLRFSRVDG